MANSIQVDALAQLLIEERIITQEKFFDKLKQVQAPWRMDSQRKTYRSRPLA